MKLSVYSCILYKGIKIYNNAIIFITDTSTRWLEVIRSDFEIHSVLWQGHITLKNEVKCKGEKIYQKKKKSIKIAIFSMLIILIGPNNRSSKNHWISLVKKKMNQIFAGHWPESEANCCQLCKKGVIAPALISRPAGPAWIRFPTKSNQAASTPWFRR